MSDKNTRHGKAAQDPNEAIAVERLISESQEFPVGEGAEVCAGLKDDQYIIVYRVDDLPEGHMIREYSDGRCVCVVDPFCG
ncbi:hypothetical protein [Fodinicurvata fenggangensis]|uniref:hypothetical protein n=1 Tax=Fodinicurvata fenggangensis TaxID=1121830 RepID=UPI0004796070|nr:hypothetical protein [Fodinicurvata fenggangensis]